MSTPDPNSADDPRADVSHEFSEETGAATGDLRENDPRDAGFSDEADRLFRSRFQRVNPLDDPSYEGAREAYRAGYDAARNPSHSGLSFDDVETDVENGWLNVRTAAGDWASVRTFAEAAFAEARAQGRVTDATPPDSSDRPSYADPIADV